jgi:nicotinate-nucleotide pyrophosphorylase (carboxylating)
MHTTSQLIDMALAEDIGPGDITTDRLIDPDMEGSGRIVAKEPAVIAGLQIAREVFHKLDPSVRVTSEFEDGHRVAAGAVILSVEGTLRALLSGERTALNFLQRLSGIATHVRTFAETLAESPVRLVDTRKTTPGWRVLEKYAVRVGGAKNHRMGLYDGVLIKDNHIGACGGLRKAVARLRSETSHLVKIEVETTDIDEVNEALEAKADIIMLDNMDIPMIRQAVEIIAGRALVEVSGNVSLESLRALADTGVDIISAGALTHSSPNVDLSMRIEERK